MYWRIISSRKKSISRSGWRNGDIKFPKFDKPIFEVELELENRENALKAELVETLKKCI
jgi:hypothetical protein